MTENKSAPIARFPRPERYWENLIKDHLLMFDPEEALVFTSKGPAWKLYDNGRPDKRDLIEGKTILLSTLAERFGSEIQAAVTKRTTVEQKAKYLYPLETAFVVSRRVFDIDGQLFLAEMDVPDPANLFKIKRLNASRKFFAKLQEIVLSEMQNVVQLQAESDSLKDGMPIPPEENQAQLNNFTSQAPEQEKPIQKLSNSQKALIIFYEKKHVRRDDPNNKLYQEYVKCKIAANRIGDPGTKRSFQNKIDRIKSIIPFLSQNHQLLPNEEVKMMEITLNENYF